MYNWPKSKQKQAEFQKDHLYTSIDSTEIQPVHPKGDQSRVFIGRTDAEAETPVL